MPTATVTRFRGISFLTAGYSVMNLIPLSLVCSDSQLAICEGRTHKNLLYRVAEKSPGDPLSYSVISTTVRTTAQT